jgi:hypothetical protein
MLLMITIPVMVFGVAIAVVPVLWGTFRFRERDGVTPAHTRENWLVLAEARGGNALEHRLDAIEQHLFARSDSQEPAT